MNITLLEILACPVCKGKLDYRPDMRELVCRIDRLAYPVRGDVPVMLVEEARELGSEDVR